MTQTSAYRILVLALLTCSALAGGSGLPLAAQSAPERGVFVTQIGEESRVVIVQRNGDSFAQVAQDGDNNQTDLSQEGTASHRAVIAQDGDDNTIDAAQDGDGSTELAIAQDGNGNTALVVQREDSARMQSAATLVQRGNDNRIDLGQDGSDNQAELTQVGDDNAMTASQLDNGNRLVWVQTGDGLSDLQITQTGGSTMQITQSNVGAAFAPPPSSPGG